MVLTALLAVTSFLGFLQAYVLSSGLAAPGRRWGYSALGCACYGVAFAMLAITSVPSRGEEGASPLGYIGLVAMLLGIVLERRASITERQLTSRCRRTGLRPAAERQHR